MPNKDDLERAIQECDDLIREYQAILRESESPKAKATARREIKEQRALREGYQAELDGLERGSRPGTTAGKPSTPPTANKSRRAWLRVAGIVLVPVVLVLLYLIFRPQPKGSIHIFPADPPSGTELSPGDSIKVRVDYSLSTPGEMLLTLMLFPTDKCTSGLGALPEAVDDKSISILAPIDGELTLDSQFMVPSELGIPKWTIQGGGTVRAGSVSIAGEIKVEGEKEPIHQDRRYSGRCYPVVRPPTPTPQSIDHEPG